MKKANFNVQFYIPYEFTIIPHLVKRKLMWKDKFDTPRCEREPYFKFEWFWLGIYGVWGDDNYWEQKLWVDVYNNGDEEKAKETWGWTNPETGKSTWVEY